MCEIVDTSEPGYFQSISTGSLRPTHLKPRQHRLVAPTCPQLLEDLLVPPASMTAF